MSKIDILIPRGFGGKDGQQALEEIQRKDELEKKKPSKISGNAIPPPNGEIECPVNHLKFRTDMICLGKNWYSTHLALNDSEWRMPTLLEFMQFLKFYGKENNFFRSIFNSHHKHSVWFDNHLAAEDLMYAPNVIDPNAPGNEKAFKPQRVHHILKNFRSAYRASLFDFDAWTGLPFEYNPQDSMQYPIGYSGPFRCVKVITLDKMIAGRGEVILSCSTDPLEEEPTRGVYACRR